MLLHGIENLIINTVSDKWEMITSVVNQTETPTLVSRASSLS